MWCDEPSAGLSRLLRSLDISACGKTLAEYIWIGAACELRSRTRVLDKVSSASQLPPWHFEDSR